MNRTFLSALTLAVIAGGCMDREIAPMLQSTVDAITPVSPPRPVLEKQVGGSDRAANQAEPQRSDRKLIRNGDMTIEVTSVEVALTSLRQVVRSIGGQLTNQVERQNEYGARIASVTWLVAAERLDAAIDAIRALGEPKVLSFTTEDVTTGYFDTSVRIATQQQLERQLVGLLSRPGNRLPDLLEIEREVARVREEIDRLEGRIKLWDHQIAMSTVVITLTEPAPIAASTGGPLATLTAAFVEAGENFVRTGAALVAFSGAAVPLVLALAGPVWVIRRANRRTRPAAAPGLTEG